MEITKVTEKQISKSSLVTVTKMNHLLEVQHMEKKNTSCHIVKLDSDTYLELGTGEIKEFKKTENRSEGMNSLRQTFKKLRYLINNNFFGLSNELFLTLTYKGDLQTKDHLKVGQDYKNFLKRLKYEYKKISSIDALKVLEPHASGNFHMHVLLRFNDIDNIYIPSAELSRIWGLGFVKIQSLSGVDNIGAYLSAYMADMDVPDDYSYDNYVEKEVNGKKKKFVKGGRLMFYPPGVNLYSKTKGILYPEREDMSYFEVKKIVGAATPHYRKSISISDKENDFSNVITYEQYNLKRL